MHSHRLEGAVQRLLDFRKRASACQRLAHAAQWHEGCLPEGTSNDRTRVQHPAIRRRWLTAAGLAATGCAGGALWTIAALAPRPPRDRVAEARDWHGLVLRDLNGTPRMLADARDTHVLHLWARWCAPCRRELPALQRWAQRLQRSGVSVLTVALDDDAFALGEFVRDIGLSLPVLLADALPAALRPDRLPQTVALAPGGRERRRVVGTRDWDTGAAQSELLGDLAPA
jgi:thiol-disulfide isomerase/thioredoxin